jgi:hypothetical protein
MDKFWSHHALKAAESAELAAVHYQKAAQLNNAGDFEEALKQALLAAAEMDNSTQHAKQANDYYYRNMINDLAEY